MAQIIGNRIWPVAIVGRGSTAAFYVTTLVRRGAAPAILAIGDGDAWSAAVRGHHGAPGDPTRFINHPMYLISHFDAHIPEFSAAKVDRLDWAEKNRRALDRTDVRLVSGLAERVERVADMPTALKGATPSAIRGFRVTLRNGDIAYARKVVLAAGAGGHRAPNDNIAQRRRQYPTHVMDLDAFAKLTATQLSSQGRPRRRVIVYGPNAAIDAIQKAVFYEADILWLVEGDRQPPVLATQPEVQQALRENPGMIRRFTTMEVGHVAGGKVSVKVDGRREEGHFFVYGMGQTGETLGVLTSELKQSLVPIIDRNRYLGDREGTILGYESEDSGAGYGLEIFGAMAPQVGRAVSKMLPARRKMIERLQATDAVQEPLQLMRGTGGAVLLLWSMDQIAAKRDWGALRRRLQREVAIATRMVPSSADALEGLMSQMLSYNAAANYRTLMAQQTQNMPRGAVADPGQLTAIGAAVAAHNTHVPRYMGHQKYAGNAQVKSPEWVTVAQPEPTAINFSRDNATTIQIGLSLKYPFIPDDRLNDWVTRHMRNLHLTGVGYVDNDRFDIELTRMNREGLEALRRI